MVPVINSALVVLLMLLFTSGAPNQAQDSQTTIEHEEKRDDLQDPFKEEWGWDNFTELEVNDYDRNVNEYTGNSLEAKHHVYRSQGEVKIVTTYPKDKTITQFKIPRVVSLLQNRTGEELRSPDTFEHIGLQLQFAIHFLSKAFPGGPSSIERARIEPIRDDGIIEEIRYGSGVWVIPLPWTADVYAREKSEDTWEYSITLKYGPDSEKKEMFRKGFLSRRPIDKVLPDEEPLDNWEARYLGFSYRDKNGKISHRTRLGDTKNFKTIGDIRNAMKSMEPLPDLAAASNEVQPKGPDFDRLMDLYYLHPSTKQAEFMIELIGSSGIFKFNKNSVAPAIAFFSEVFAANKDRLDEWIAEIEKLDDDTRAVFEEAVERSENPKKFLKEEAPSSKLNDMCWGGYFATGEWIYLEKLIEHLRYLDVVDDLNLFFTGASAKWSLASNARRHPGVRDALVAAQEDADERLKFIIIDVLTVNPDEVQEEILEILESRVKSGQLDPKQIKSFEENQ
ncbi:MAG: hypothetical protein ACYTG7_19820 [Planctomycetota bacterium]